MLIGGLSALAVLIVVFGALGLRAAKQERTAVARLFANLSQEKRDLLDETYRLDMEEMRKGVDPGKCGVCGGKSS